jgi:hypothetical protein
MNAACRPMFMAVITFVVAVFVMVANPLHVSGQTLLGFKTPSSNIFCMLDDDNAGVASLRCDITQMTSAPLRKPRDCPLDWGDAFFIAKNGTVGVLVCHGDTVADDRMPVLPYGAVWKQAEFTCTSQTDGLTCVNAEGHGFALSRAVQRVF